MQLAKELSVQLALQLSVQLAAPKFSNRTSEASGYGVPIQIRAFEFVRFRSLAGLKIGDSVAASHEFRTISFPGFSVCDWCAN